MPLTEVLVIWKVLPGFWLVRKSIAVVFLQHDSSGVTAHYSDCHPGQSLSFSILWGWERFMKLFPLLRQYQLAHSSTIQIKRQIALSLAVLIPSAWAAED